MWKPIHITLGLAILQISQQGQAQQDANIRLHDAEDLDPSLGHACVEALSSAIDCHIFVQTFTELAYRQSLGNIPLTNEICEPGCSASLKTWFDSVTSACEGKSLYGSLPNKLGGYIWAGWNETCLRDPRTHGYCNDIMDGFTAVSDLADMPREELCHFCHVCRLAMMQSSRYSTYDEFWQAQLVYIYQTCGGNGPTEIPKPLEEDEEPAPAPSCATNKQYSTKEGDTCESIANATSASAADVYMTNQELLPDCQDTEPGVTICLPQTCRTYYIKPRDTCTRIEYSHDLPLGSLKFFNSWLDAYCTNLHTATEFYGKIICVSPQGGLFKNPQDSAPAGELIPSNGYTTSLTAPPDDAIVADGTTLNCGEWHKVRPEDSCALIRMVHGITEKLFHQSNPSLGDGAQCTKSLVVDTALCVKPTYIWDLSGQLRLDGGRLASGTG